MAKQNAGKIFEFQIINSIPNYMYKLRLKDISVRFKNDTNPCDMIVFYDGRFYMFELKSTKNSSLPFANIHYHQFKDLELADKIEGLHAGFLIEMRKYNETYYLPIKKALDYVENSGRKSFSIDFLRENGIKIRQTLKRTRYTFDMEKLITEDLGE